MFKNFSAKLVDASIQKNIVEADKKEEYIYGINTFFTIVFNILSALIIGALMKMIFEIILFITVYKTMRKYVGGGHSENALRCYISSCVTYVIVLLIAKNYFIPFAYTIIVVCLCTAVILIIAPVESKNKPLDEIEYNIFGIRGKIITIICSMLCILFGYVSYVDIFNHCFIIMALAIITVTIFAIEGKLKNLIYECND